MGLLKCCLLFGRSEFTVDEKDEEEMDTGATDELHALLIKCSHLFVAETLDEEATLLTGLVALFAPPIDGVLNDTELTDSIDDVTVTGGFDILAWLVDIKK